jgi:hypothetical protein
MFGYQPSAISHQRTSVRQLLAESGELKADRFILTPGF